MSVVPMEISVDRSKPVPLYHQIAEYLENQIRTGRLQAGDRLPGEVDLARLAGVSRITAKQALQALEQQSLVQRRQGLGTFVLRPAIPRKLNRLLSFQEEMSQRGLTVATKVLTAGVTPSDERVAGALRLDPGDPVVRVRRLRIVGEHPVALQTSYLPTALAGELLKHPQALKGSLYELLGQMGVRPVRGVEHYAVAAVDPSTALLLGIKSKEPVFRCEREAYLADDTAVEFARSVLRGDRYSLQVELRQYDVEGPQA